MTADLRRHAPELADLPLRPLGRGTGHEAVRAGATVLRRGTGPDAVPEARREAALLAALGPLLPLPLPAPRFADAGVLAYPLLPGRPLLDRIPPPGAARSLGLFLRVLHGLDPALLPALPTEPAEPAAWLADLDGPADLLAVLRSDVPPAGTRPVPAHADLGAEHLLTDGGVLTGVLDWSDAAVTDPRWTWPGPTGTSVRPSSPSFSTSTARSTPRPAAGSCSSPARARWRTSPTAPVPAGRPTPPRPGPRSAGCSGPTAAGGGAEARQAPGARPCSAASSCGAAASIA